MFSSIFRGLTSKTNNKSDALDITTSDSTFVALADVPQYLRGGSLYQSYVVEEPNEEMDGKIEVPMNCFKQDPSVASIQDLRLLCQSVRYWIVEFPPNNIDLFRFSFSFWKNNRASVCEICSQFQNEIPYIRNFMSVFEVSCDKMVTKAAEFGMLDVVQFLHEELSLSWNSSTCAAAASNGHIACLTYLHENKCPWNEETLLLAGTNGHLACLQYAQSHDFPYKGGDVLSGAVERGQLECVKFMIEQGWYTLDAINDISAKAAASGNVNMLAYFLSAGLGSREEVCHGAALHGHLACLEYAFSQGCPIDRSAYCSTLAGSRECLMFALNNGEPLAESAQSVLCNAAINGGFVDCLEAAHEHGFPLTKIMMLFAVRLDQMECVKYMHSQNCPWDADVTAIAALHGRLACLQYLHEHGCAWDERTVKASVNQSCRQYAQTHGCPGSSQ